MKIIEYYQSPNKELWKGQIKQSDWAAGKLLFSLLDNNQLQNLCGDSTKLYLLTDGDKLVSFATLAQQDEIDAPQLSPWIGFVYTFPFYRDNHYAGKLIEHICQVSREASQQNIYVSTNEVGLYEKYGFRFLQNMLNREGKTTRVYIKDL